MNYAQWLQWMLTTLQISGASGVTAFTALAPMFIAYAEGRLYRDPDLDFLATRAVDVSKFTTGGIRSVAIPSTFIVIEGVSLVTPANTVPTTSGARRIPYRRTTRSFIDFTWPIQSQTQSPDAVNGGYYALFSEQEASPAPSEDDAIPLPSAILLAPTPDDVYRVEISGTQRPTPLSSTNATTFLTQYLPDLFFAATMIAGVGYQRDFGAQSDDPGVAISWERLFQQLRRDAGIEEWRKKSLVGGFSSLPPKSMTEPPQMPAAPAGVAAAQTS